MDRITCESLDASWAIRRVDAWASSPAARLSESVAGAPSGQAPVRLSRSQTRSGLMTLRARYRRSPEGCFESGLAVPDGHGVPSWLEAAACEPRRNRVPSSRCTLFPLDVMTEAAAAPAAPPERLKPRRPNTPVLRVVSIRRRPRRRPPQGWLAERRRRAQTDPTVSATAPVVRPSKPPPRLVPASPPAPLRAPASRHCSRRSPPRQPPPGFRHGGAESHARLGSPPCQRRSPSMNPFDLQRPRASDTCPIKLPLGMDVPPSVLEV